MVHACRMYVLACMGVHLCAARSRSRHRHAMSFLPGHGVTVAKTRWHLAKVMNFCMTGGVDAHLWGRVMWVLRFNEIPEYSRFTGNGVCDD